jgi:hypothetical protein
VTCQPVKALTHRDRTDGRGRRRRGGRRGRRGGHGRSGGRRGLRRWEEKRGEKEVATETTELAVDDVLNQRAKP